MSDDGPLFFDEEQLALLSEEELGPLFSEEEKDGLYTAERFKRLNPEKFEWVCTLLADPGMSYRRIAKLAKCHAETLKAIVQRHQNLLDAHKERLKSGLADVANKSIELIAENLESVPVKTTTDLQKLSILAAVTIDKHELLSGNATSRVARQEERLEDVRDHFDSLPAGPEPIDAEYTDITSFSGETPGQKGDEPDPGPSSPGSGSDGAETAL